MKVAVIGGGGREHAIIRKLNEDGRCSAIYAIPGNGGIAGEATCLPLKATDIPAVVQQCRQLGVDYVVVAPDDPLALGMVDALAAQGIPAFGPTRAAARIEASKVFAKALMKMYNIPTADFESFGDAAAALDYIRRRGRYPVVVKADGLALGKGVLICQNEAEATDAIQTIMVEKKFGDSGARVVVEEFLTGPEVSVLAFCDGETLVPMVSSMDHKRALDGDAGPNTGGMGTVAPNPHYTPAMAQRSYEEIFLPTVRALQTEGAPFKGCLYFGLMLTADGPKVIEYNCRFGDPETQVVLPLLESDLLEIMRACTEGRLREAMVRFAPGAAACVVMASGGYPEKYATGLPITGLAEAERLPGVAVYHAGTRLENGQLLTSGGRVLGVTAVAPTLSAALSTAYQAAGAIHFEGAHYRRDIGKSALSVLAHS
ncbi:MAG: phosphoribosylamine--glycine ligase [Oscillospiraceae bacterium]